MNNLRIKKTLLLFLIMDPFGNLIVVNTILAGIPQQKPADDRRMYSSLDGESNVADEDASSDESWQEDAQDDLQDYE